MCPSHMASGDFGRLSKVIWVILQTAANVEGFGRFLIVNIEYWSILQIIYQNMLYAMTDIYLFEG